MSTVVYYNITTNQMTAHLSYNNKIIQCIDRTWGIINFSDETLYSISTTSKLFEYLNTNYCNKMYFSHNIY